MPRHKLNSDSVGSRSLSSSATRTVATATLTLVNLDTNRALQGMTWDDTNKAFIIGKAGLYQANASLTYKLGSGTGRCEVKIYNGATQVCGGLLPISTDYATVGVSSCLRFAVGDSVKLYAYQNTGSSRTLHDPDWCWLDLIWLTD